MDKFIITGGKPLRGAVRLGGAKNASFKLMIAAALADTESRLLNLSHIGDVEVTEMTLKALGIGVTHCGERTIFITPHKLLTSQVPQFSGEKTRASTLFASVLLALTGKAIIPQPGGCVLGKRPIDRHLEGLRAMGVEIEVQDTYITLECRELKGATVRFPKKTHTGTEAIILAAVKAHGRTIIENAGLEPEIDDLIAFLNKMGAKIQRSSYERIIIDGVEQLHGAIYRVMPDRNEAVSYAVAALATKGDIVVENAREADLKTFLSKLEEIGANFDVANYGIRFWYDKPLKCTNIKTAPEPGFMTDWQPMWTILMTQSQGESEVIEAVTDQRFQYAEQLNQMGANITLFNPEVAQPEEYYDFCDPINSKGFHAAKVAGPTPLVAQNLVIPDLRAGATLTIAALIAKGQTQLTGIEHVERGYENLEGRLRQLGAEIVKIHEAKQTENYIPTIPSV